ncbi:MAG: DUF4363 domain-containing protein [Oscillatoriophycideae cyanobacterium NC_groundwater_1537_Pr4_S-0.65um_50_18]|nr:DUF4363 domain-containing protein [Oscillatoriophycideae cyanobacterium NC_groundwater_1537_Pr4_S-0.65um_50_18]
MIRFNQAIAIGATLGILTLAGCSTPQQSATTEPASPSAMTSEASPDAVAGESNASPDAMSNMTATQEYADLTTVVASTTAAVDAGDFTKAQAEIAKFEEPWSKVEKSVKAKSGDTYNAIEDNVEKVQTALNDSNKEQALVALKALGESVSLAAK